MNRSHILSAAIAAMFIFTGCFGPDYGDAEIKDAERKGQLIINYNLPEGARLKSVHSLEDILLGGRRRLTDYAYGEYTLDGADITYYVNVVTEDIYTSENFSVLEEAAAELPLEALGLDKERVQYTINNISLVLPHDENSELSDCFLQKVLPAGTDNIEAFVDSKDRPLISASCTVTVPDDADIFSYDLEKIRSAQKTHGIYFSDLRIYNESNTESLHIEKNKYENYSRKETADFGDYLFYGTVCQRTERFMNGSISSETHDYSLEGDIIREKTNKGYRFSYRQELLKTKYRPEFILLARDGSDILKYDYILHYDGADHSTECFWEQREDGMWALRASYGNYTFEMNSTDMTAKE